MKYFFIISIFLLFFTGCSEKNAFVKFKMSKDEEQSVSSLQTSQIKFKNAEIAGVISAVYLNEIYPERFKEYDSFFVYIYMKDSKNTDSINPKINLEMNEAIPKNITELSSNNEFTHLVDIKSSWNRYYLVEFEKDCNTLNLTFDNGLSMSSVLKYIKGDQ
ncbi:hypothetical protein [Sulfurimonas sp.]|uniref:hypothetical protein n=1 Tax=Sulfurimonas sp. TaxID=2022749 RepID=UPI0025F928DA|nr:hypothetical protein [Sulfurimonas sp.]MDD5156975.1 hypothetical protein [Sulfurimonas sp.]